MPWQRIRKLITGWSGTCVTLRQASWPGSCSRQLLPDGSTWRATARRPASSWKVRVTCQGSAENRNN